MSDAKPIGERLKSDTLTETMPPSWCQPGPQVIQPAYEVCIVHVLLFDRVTKKQYASIPCTELGIAIATAKAQKDLAIVENGKVMAAYLDGQMIDMKEIKPKEELAA